MERNYFGIALYHPSKEPNIGNVLRTSYNFGAAFVCLITKQKVNLEKYKQDTTKSHRYMPVFIFPDYETLQLCKPKNCKIVCIEINEKAKNLMDIEQHDDNVIYLFGPETSTIKKSICEINQCYYIPTKYCLNLATTVGIVLYDRILKNKNNYDLHLPKSKFLKNIMKPLDT